MANNFFKSKEEIAEWERVHQCSLDNLIYQDKCIYIKNWEESEKQCMNQKPVSNISAGSKNINDYRNKIVVIAPEIRPTKNQPVKYDEVLGDDMDVEDVYYDIREAMTSNHHADNGVMTGTYKIKGKNGRKVIAQSTLPKENAAITFRPGYDMFPVVTFQGRSGYLWTHHSLPNFKEELMKSGYYEEYSKEFDGTRNVFYLTGLLCCDINKVHSVMNAIESKEKARRRGGHFE